MLPRHKESDRRVDDIARVAWPSSCMKRNSKPKRPRDAISNGEIVAFRNPGSNHAEREVCYTQRAAVYSAAPPAKKLSSRAGEGEKPCSYVLRLLIGRQRHAASKLACHARESVVTGPAKRRVER